MEGVGLTVWHIPSGHKGFGFNKLNPLLLYYKTFFRNGLILVLLKAYQNDFT
jgi:hypothetical protein